ncbi:MAG: hypothetical protein MJB14_22600 [Spirochaetes bacterium]|nr:hypothetical protein [Spirochaetota bacterium]
MFLKILKILGLMLILCLLLAGCAASFNEFTDSEDSEGKIAGFWMGLWHGIIAPICFIISLFNKNVGIYELHNNGAWYHFGYILGLMIIFGSGGHGSGRVRK